MKTVLDYMNQIAALMEHRRPAKGGPWQVILLDGHLMLGKVAETVLRDSIILHLTAQDINNGLINWQWDMIYRKLSILIREGKLK